MKTLIATATLTIMFLSAGAFASNNKAPTKLQESVNITVIAKNQVWPVPGQTTLDPCSANLCFEI